MLAYQSNLPMSSSVSLRLAEVERLRRQRDKLDMLLNRAQRHLLVDLAALRAMRAQESSWGALLITASRSLICGTRQPCLGKTRTTFKYRRRCLSCGVLTRRSSGRRAVGSPTTGLHDRVHQKCGADGDVRALVGARGALWRQQPAKRRGRRPVPRTGECHYWPLLATTRHYSPLLATTRH